LKEEIMLFRIRIMKFICIWNFRPVILLFIGDSVFWDMLSC
jgi:hypothetical protein